MLIVIEGLDGSGKSTQLKLLSQNFLNHQIPYEFLHFPRTNTSVFGELIARFLRGEFGDIEQVNPYLVALLFAGDRYNAAAIINNWLVNNKLVIVDRYVLSNIAYQCAKLTSIHEQEKLKQWIFHLEYNYYNIPKPDLQIFLDVPINFVKKNLENQRIGADRNYLKGSYDIHEKNLTFQKKVRNLYLQLLSSEPNMHVIQCFKDELILPADEIFKQILNILKNYKIIN